MLIGGAQLYATLLPRCDRLYVTRVDASVEGDAVFPAIDLDEWALTQSEGPQKGPKDQFSFDVAVFDRVSSIMAVKAAVIHRGVMAADNAQIVRNAQIGTM